MEQFLDILKSLIEPTVIIIGLILLLYVNKLIFRRINSNSVKGNSKIVKNSIATLLVLTGVVAFILNIPLDKELKGQILSFLAIIVSAGIALSSTTILGNLMAGLMNNSMNRFRNGDLIKVGDFLGRVTKTNIFHVEIQLEDSNFISIPNLFVATHPVKLPRKVDSVISTSVSLGYDVSRVTIEKTLINAAKNTGLTDPYVYITDLGDFSVTYKIHGFLKDSNKFFSTSSLLNANVMDALHKQKIEIVSPTFMNRRDSTEKVFIPTESITKESKSTIEKAPEDLVFDEAIKSEEIEKKKDELKELQKQKEEIKEQKEPEQSKEEIKKINKEIKKVESTIKKIKEPPSKKSK